MRPYILLSIKKSAFRGGNKKLLHDRTEGSIDLTCKKQNSCNRWSKRHNPDDSSYCLQIETHLWSGGRVERRPHLASCADLLHASLEFAIQSRLGTKLRPIFPPFSAYQSFAFQGIVTLLDGFHGCIERPCCCCHCCTIHGAWARAFAGPFIQSVR